jgi:predicted nucleic acid-binding protein
MTAELVFVDTDVLVYARDSRDPRKQQRAGEWLAHLWRHRIGRLSLQVLQEYYVSVTQKLKPGMERDAARRDVRDLWHWVPASSAAGLLEAAWALQDQFSVSWWDALILSSAQLAGCQTLLSEDFQHGQQFGAVRVSNPFRSAPKEDIS